MSGYKRIMYVDCYMEGTKVENVGFARLIKRDKIQLQIHISDDAISEVVWGNVKLCMGTNVFSPGKMELSGGKGIFQIDDLERLLSETDVFGNCEEMSLQIEVGERMYLCKLDALADLLPEKAVDKKREIQMEEVLPQVPVFSQNEETVVADEIPVVQQEIEKEHKKMHADKWLELMDRYPAICPFQDNRRYLRLDLQELIILPGQYYRLVENSFLLHGYYNYEHLVLARVCRRGAEKYYIGVPGNYYEKEKQVAVLFGFESFEPGSENPKEGDFGYYMISVDL